MKTLILVCSLFFTLTACSPEPQTSEFSDDYSLIEFAAKLEEESAPTSTQPLEENPLTNVEK